MVATTAGKPSSVHVERDAEKANTLLEDPALAEREIYHDHGAILVDLNTTGKGGQAAALKTARDGHVRTNLASCLPDYDGTAD